jgi:hypothetical protein
MLRKHAPAAEDAHVRNLPSGVAAMSETFDANTPPLVTAY